jgi:hypothetical protein
LQQINPAVLNTPSVDSQRYDLNYCGLLSAEAAMSRASQRQKYSEKRNGANHRFPLPPTQ